MMVITAVLLMVLSPFHNLLVRDLLAIVLFLVIIPVSIILALILLRLSTYFRDNYRATNYGVPDLVELIRQLDLAVVQMRQSKGRPTNEPRIKLSFIGHSMGCFVVTNTIRILSDVFDPPSINKTPTAEIGNVFCLERLILVAPDIPVETVIPRRANFLRASLRRCQEAYIFASEGDLAVRLASTAANYFSFPARTKFSGYRLGNLTVQRQTYWNYALSTGQWRTSPLTSGRMMPKTSPTSTWKFALAIASAKH
ncbi:MAG: alpha/beta hydrolase [Leptodesmis sp.]|uniref:alpha/beta hydrolase n=1 Tax=Leptodesmis sp. TaxID=3100501 RepID=UPI003D0D839F